MSNFKAAAVADVLASDLQIRSGLSASTTLVSGVPTIAVGNNTVAGAGGATIQIRDQRNENTTDPAWGALPGFMVPSSSPQPVYTTGVAKMIVESQGSPGTANVFAVGTLTIGAGADSPIGAGKKVTIAGQVLTEGVDFAAGADDGASAVAIANAINANAVLAPLVTAVYQVGGTGINSTVKVFADLSGVWANSIDTTTDGGPVAAWGAATLLTGAGDNAATGILSIGGGLNTAFGAGATVTIAGTVLTEGVDFAAGASAKTSAVAIAAAINANATLSPRVMAYATQGAATSTVTVVYRYVGVAGNVVTTVTNDAVATWGAATLTGGTGPAADSLVMPAANFMKIWAELAKRGLKLELWETNAGTAPTSGASSVLVAEFFPNLYWPLSGLV